MSTAAEEIVTPAEQPRVVVLGTSGTTYEMFELEAASEASTRITITTKETFSLTDWGRGKRAAQRLLGAVGAT